MTRVLFHLGMPKTGTTLLQNTMARAVPALRAEGVLYPRAGRIGAAHHPVAQLLRDRGPEERVAFLAELGAEIAGAQAEGPSPRVALVSSEGMINSCGADRASDLAAFLASPGAGLQGTAVIFLREMTSYLESFYLQTTRFRALDMTFEDYMPPRIAWVGSFLAGLTLIRDRMGDAFEIALAGRGYDVLRAFETRLGLRDGFLDEPSREVDAMERPGLKGQIVLTHLDWVAGQVGFAINRRKLARHLSGEGVFAGDVARFTVYPPGERERIAEICVRIIEEAGFHDYAALTRAMPPATLPHHRIDRALLTPADIAVVRSLRAAIEDRPRPDPAALRAERQAARAARRQA